MAVICNLTAGFITLVLALDTQSHRSLLSKMFLTGCVCSGNALRVYRIDEAATGAGSSNAGSGGGGLAAVFGGGESGSGTSSSLAAMF